MFEQILIEKEIMKEKNKTLSEIYSNLYQDHLKLREEF
jgi:hypothetical protein